MSIQLNREKQRSKELYDELNALRNTAHTSSDKAGLTTSTLTRANHELTTEVNHLAAKVLDLELHLNSARKASDQTREDFRRVKLVFEGRLEECQKTTSQTITSAETSLTHYNDEWAKKLEQERILWVKKMRAQEEMTEHNLMSVQTQFSDAHDFYADHIKKVNKEKQREEERRRAVMDELEATREELVREKAARKALTSQLKKERKWREKCLNLTQQTMELRSENEEGKEEPTLPEKSRLQVDTPHPAQAPHTPLDPASKAYLQAVDEYVQMEGAPVAHVNLLDEERRKNKLLMLELLRQRTMGHAQAAPDTGGWSHMSSPTHTNVTQQYFPLGSPSHQSHHFPVNDREVAALRVAVERADIERVLEAEIGLERGVEQDGLRIQLESQRKQLEAARKTSQEKELMLTEAERRSEQEKSEWVEREKKRSGAIEEIVASSKHMYEELESEKERNRVETEALRRAMDDERVEMSIQLANSREEVERMMEEQAMSLKETRRAQAGSGVVPDNDEREARDVIEGGHKKVVKAKRSSIHMSVPDVVSIDYSALTPVFSAAPAPSASQLEIATNPAVVAAVEFFGEDNGSQNYPSIAAYARTPDRDATFHGRMFKLYSAIHSCVVNDEKNLPSVLANLESKYKLIADPSAKVPTVAFGKTGIDMPTLTLGTMRFQETWNGAKHTDPAKIDADVDSACQANLKATLLYALERGINHIETARGYGASEIQLGKAIKEILAEGVYKREDLIIQTKVGAKDTREEFISTLETSFEYMGVDYFDLFSFHGLNKYKDFDKVFNETDGLYAALEPYLADGRIKHVGFSTHGPTDLISKLIASEKFAYVNLHYHWCGSYTAGGHTPTVADAGPGNESCVKMARDLNMGVFCISPLDKGGGVHNASYKFRKMTENEGLDPVEFSVGWTCGVHDTQTIGCARPEDLDEVYHAAICFPDTSFKARLAKVQTAVNEALVAVSGEEWCKTWFRGLPTCFESETGTNITHYVWFYNLLHAFGLKWYVEQRAGTGVNNRKGWDKMEGGADERRKDWGFMPGNCPIAGMDYSEELKNVPAENLERVKGIIEDFEGLVKQFDNDECKSVDMRPWKAFPERG